MDVYDGNTDFQAVGVADVINGSSSPSASGLRNGIGNNNLKYGAAYYPWLKTLYNFAYDETELSVTGSPYGSDTTLRKDIPPGGDSTLEAKSIFHQNTELYQQIVAQIARFDLLLPPGPAIAGVYAAVDNNRGVWKAPANVSLNSVKEPGVILTDDAQEGLNVHTSGKSVNAIRQFSGKGILVWGARTLAGNDNEWRYVSVRRFYNMVEESVKKATQKFVFEPNDANTWAKVRGMISNYLTTLWRQGALAGASPDEAFFVSVGLGETMTAQDILEGRMNVEIGMAAVRPAEFIILKFSHKLQEA
ncbi:MAG: phage tail sheath C-terminal domain-containing protein [Bacteroidales bacterium]